MQIFFLYIDITDENLAKPFLTLYGIEESKNTVVSFLIINYLSYYEFFFPQGSNDNINEAVS